MPVVALFILVTGCVSTKAEKSVSALYFDAVKDAVFIEPDEIHELVRVTPESELVTFNESKDKVLVLNCNNYPESYVPGKEFLCKYGVVWTFTDKEIVKWYSENKKDITDWRLRFNQLIGVAGDKDYKCVTALWVNLADLRRPAYEPDITKQIDSQKLSRKDVPEITDWFSENILYSYFDSAAPWTRLGYTYDWADNGTEYGLTEFIILKGATVDVEWTKTQDEFLEWLEESVAQLKAK